MVSRARVSAAKNSNGHTAKPPGDGQRPRAAEPPLAAFRQAWRSIGRRLPQMKKDVSCYAAAHADRARLSMSRMVRRLAWHALLIIAVASTFAMALWLVMIGVAGGIASALDGNLWLANLITGAGVLLLLAGSTVLSIQIQRASRLRRLERRYEGHATRHDDVTPTNANGAENHAKRS